MSCTPRDSFAWLLAFDFEVLHGRLNQHSFDLLAMSYRTSPNEAWIAIRPRGRGECLWFSSRPNPFDKITGDCAFAYNLI